MAWDPDHDQARLNLSIVESYLPPPSIVNLPSLNSNPALPQASSFEKLHFPVTIELPLQPQYRPSLPDLPAVAVAVVSGEELPFFSSRTLHKSVSWGAQDSNFPPTQQRYPAPLILPMDAIGFRASTTPLTETGPGRDQEGGHQWLQEPAQASVVADNSNDLDHLLVSSAGAWSGIASPEPSSPVVQRPDLEGSARELLPPSITVARGLFGTTRIGLPKIPTPVLPQSTAQEVVSRVQPAQEEVVPSLAGTQIRMADTSHSESHPSPPKEASTGAVSKMDAGGERLEEVARKSPPAAPAAIAERAAISAEAASRISSPFDPLDPRSYLSGEPASRELPLLRSHFPQMLVGNGAPAGPAPRSWGLWAALLAGGYLLGLFSGILLEPVPAKPLAIKIPH